MAGAAALCAALVVAGCSSSSGGTNSAAPTGSTTAGRSAPGGGGVAAADTSVKKYTAAVATYPSVAPVKGAAALRGKTVWFVPLGATLPAIAAQGAAMTSALKRLGIHIHVCDGQLLPTTVSSCLNQAVQQGASAVVTAFVDYKMVPAAMDNVTSHHIPLLVAGEDNDAGSGKSNLLGFFSTDLLVNKLATLGADAVIAASAGTARILYLGSNDSPSLVALNTAAAQHVKTACPKCSFTGLSYASTETQKVPAQISAALIQHPDTNYILLGADTVLAQVIQGVSSAGATNKLKVSTLGGDLSPLQLMKAGNHVIADAGFSSTYLGWGFADGVVRLMTGQQPVTYFGGIRLFTPDNVGDITLTPAAFATNAWYGSDAYQAAFLNAWTGK